jgi:fucose 4-O-acetylase-like acetyltransferase
MSIATASPAVQDAAAPSRPARDPWPDNAKLVLIVLVAIGHLLSKGITERMPEAQTLYVWIYLFHMPAFIFLAGYFSGGRRVSERATQSIVTRQLIPFVAFTVLYAVAIRVGTGRALRIDLVDPYWLLWFLPALAAWRLLTPLLLNLRAPVAISVVLGLGVGMLDRVASDFTLSRIFAFAPFFVLGAVTTPERLRKLTGTLPRIAGATTLVSSLAVVGFFHDRIGSPAAILWNEGYEGQGLSTAEGMGLRLALYAVSLALLLSVLSVVPTRRTWLTSIGAASLYVYLLHGFLVRGASASGALDHVEGLLDLAVLIVLTAGVCLLLGSPIARRCWRPVVEPRLTWLLRPDDPTPAPTPDAHWSKSSTTSSESGEDWQASTKPSASSSGSSA